MNSDFRHPGIALLLGIALAVIPILGIAKGTLLFIGLQKRSERPAFFWLGVTLWWIIIGIIVIGSGRELATRHQEGSSNQQVHRTP